MKPIYKVNEDYFKKIDTQNKAYFLGMLYADGNVTDCGHVRIELAAADKHILEDLKKEIEYDGPLLFRKSDNPKHQDKYSLSINRVSMMKDLCNIGCVPAKTAIIKFPSNDIVPTELMYHFIRGFYDGDGGIDEDITYVGFTTHDMFALDLHKFIAKDEIYSTNFYYRNPERKSPFGTLSYSRLIDYYRLLQKMYENAELKLERKYNKYLELVDKVKERKGRGLLPTLFV